MAPLHNQILMWLMLPKVWRFSGFASALVGMLCFALSSSFNSLFGEWNFLKTFLYIIFSSIICIAVLFAKAWQHSSSLRFKAHMAFLVLTITSFYSSFFDKHAKGEKPDTYNLVSCAAFAVMTLSLSRQTHCGYEVDLLYFFLGALIVQLTKIKWLLGIVGMIFSYSLIILRSCLDAQQEANGYSGVQDQPQVNIQVGSLQLLASIDDLKKMNTTILRRLYNYHHQYLGKPFQPDHNLFIDWLPLEIINNLKEAMKVAVEAGFEEECCQLYTSCRKEFLIECFSALKMQDIFNNESDNVGTTTERIQSWIRASAFAVKIVFPNERRLCDRVFFGLSSIGDLSFVRICKEPTISLLKFPKTFKVDISMLRTGREFEKVVRALPGIIPELESLFPGQDMVSISNEAIATRKRLCEAFRNIFKETVNLIRCDTRVVDVPGGIYPITSDIMDNLRVVIDFILSIKKAWEEYPVSYDGEGTSPSFHAEMAWIIEQLESHLEEMSKNYTEPALFNVSIMNNLMYIKQEIMSWQFEDLGKPLGFHPFFFNDQIQQYTSKLQRNLEDYQRVSWNELLGLLKLDSESVALSVIVDSMTEKLQLFNIQFAQICNIQSKWFAIDDIRKEIIKGLENMLLPAYGNFIGKFQNVLGKHASENIRFGMFRYGMFDIKARLNDMFLGDKREINNQKWRRY